MKYEKELLEVINLIRDSLETLDFNQLQIFQDQQTKKYPYKAYKEQERKGLNEGSISPVIHINTLAQILYESFRKLDKKNSLIKPIILINDSSAVTGVQKSGAYFINLEQDELIKIDDNVKNMHNKDDLFTRLAIGYTFFLEKFKKTNKDAFTNQIIQELTFMIHQIQNMLVIHGELTDVIKVPAIAEFSTCEEEISPVFLYQELINVHEEGYWDNQKN
ncbi:hypothetical protein BHL37_23450 [Bacillus cereus]|nr:hypothetical protein BHL37_23450 [Bacillus cereus]